MLGTNSTQFAGQGVNSVGGPNNWAPSMTVQANDGNAQHSQLGYEVLVFNEPVTINTTNLASVFGIKDSSNTSLNLVITSNGTVTGSTLTNVTQVVIKFASGSPDSFNFVTPYAVNTSGAIGGSQTVSVGLNDGNYFLSTNGSAISNNGVLLDTQHNGAGSGGTQADETWRLFGDSRGSRIVDGLSASDFRLANNQSASGKSSNPNYKWYFDVNGDANVDVSNTIDQNAFKANYTKTLAP